MRWEITKCSVRCVSAFTAVQKRMSGKCVFVQSQCQGNITKHFTQSTSDTSDTCDVANQILPDNLKVATV